MTLDEAMEDARLARHLRDESAARHAEERSKRQALETLGMRLDEYQQAAMRTSPGRDGSPPGLAYLALGVAGEAGEVADYVKKVVGHGHPLDGNKLARELGDVLWYVAVLAKVVGLSLSDVAEMNIQKLRERYPEGFDPERSLNRKEEP